jgi:multiple sugar transport system permease protein
MSTVALPDRTAALPAGPRRGMSPWQFWGLVLIAPYALIFLVFVLYPVVYGLWLARNPASYVTLVNDPIFIGSVVNTIVFLVVAINVKMMVALFLSGFFVHDRVWIRSLSVL